MKSHLKLYKRASDEAALAIITHQGLAAAQEPFRLYWTGVCVLSANDDPRALNVLRTGSRLLETTAAKLEDGNLRQSFLEHVASNRQLRAAGQAAGMI